MSWLTIFLQKKELEEMLEWKLLIKIRVRSFIKKVELAIEKADKKLAQEAFKVAQPEMHRSVTKGVFKKNTISRKLSRLSSGIKNIA